MGNKIEKNDIDKGLLLLMAVSCGVVVANIYYIQPLLGEVADYFHVGTSTVGIVATLTQLGYAAGLFFILPAADLYNRRKLILSMLAICIVSLLLMAISGTFILTAGICFLVGFTSMVPQLMIPLGAQLSLPENRGKNIGTIMSGLLIGILASRVFSGLIGNALGWKCVYITASVIIIVLEIILWFKLPDIPTSSDVSYGQSLKSVFSLPKKYPVLIHAAINGFIVFGIFNAFWTTLTFYLGGDTFGYSTGTIGLFGLFGIAGATLAPVAGRMTDKHGADFTVLFHIIVVAIAFVVFALFGKSVFGIIGGVILLDYGVQCCNVANQARIQALSEQERNRITSVYMVLLFLGGSIGSTAGTYMFQSFGWTGFVVMGTVLILIAFILHILLDMRKEKVNLHL